MRHTFGRGQNAGQFEFSKRFVFICLFAFPLQNVDFNGVLIIGNGCENQRFARRDRGIFIDNDLEIATAGFNAEGKGSDVQQYDVLDFRV